MVCRIRWSAAKIIKSRENKVLHIYFLRKILEVEENKLISFDQLHNVLLERNKIRGRYFLCFFKIKKLSFMPDSVEGLKNLSLVKFFFNDIKIAMTIIYEFMIYFSFKYPILLKF